MFPVAGSTRGERCSSSEPVESWRRSGSVLLGTRPGESHLLDVFGPDGAAVVGAGAAAASLWIQAVFSLRISSSVKSNNLRVRRGNSVSHGSYVTVGLKQRSLSESLHLLIPPLHEQVQLKHLL